MASFQNIKKQLLPLIKGLPIVVILFIISIFMAKKIIQYTPRMYLSVAKIKLDNQKFGASNSLLYKDFDVFTSEDKIESEAELLGSHLLIKKALDKVELDIAINRIGKIRNTSLYKNSPIDIEYDFIDAELFDVLFELTITENDMVIKYKNNGIEIVQNGKLNSAININGNQITVNKNDSLIKLKSLALDGQYSFLIYSEEGLINKVKEQLDVKAIDKEMSVLRVVFKDQSPSKTADFNNALCETYIEDYISTKTYAANKTVNFIDLKLKEIGKDLAKAEQELESYKMRNDVVNTRQETETGLRQLSNLQIQLVNTEMNEKAILELEEYIKNGNYFEETAINFGFGDLLMTELVKKMKLWNDEKQDLLIKYKEGSDQINAVNYKIEEVKKYIVEAIKSNKREIITKREKLEAELKILSTQFDDIPTREKDLQILDREFSLQESVYNFLSQKRIEAFIASSSSTSFHRIIQPAYQPKLPASPNKTLITFVCGLLGLIVGITFVYLRQFARAKVMEKSDLERNSQLPIAGIIRNVKLDIEAEYLTLSKSLLLKKTIHSSQVIVVTSSLAQEGKTISVENLGIALMSLGHKVCLIDFDNLNYDLSATFYKAKDFMVATTKDFNENGLVLTTKNEETLLEEDYTLFKSKLDELKAAYDFVIIDTSPTAISITPIQLMKLADLNLYTIKADFTPISYINNADLLGEEYELKNIQFLLTNVHKASNYNGNLIGSRFENKGKRKGIINRVKQYINYYL
jgi:uncharacterized protein involved in exopolysaccharide biosynthesis